MEYKLGLIGASYKVLDSESRVELIPKFIELKNQILKLDKENEVVFISTCNRVELYYFAKVLPNFDVDNCYIINGINVSKHLFKVAAGADSMLLGETEILGQLKDSYEKALKSKESKKFLNRLFQETFKFAKKARNLTTIGQNKVTYPSVVLGLINSIFNQKDIKVLIVGFGKLGSSIYKYLNTNNYNNITVTNRTSDKVKDIELFLNFNSLSKHINSFQIIIIAADLQEKLQFTSKELSLVCDLSTTSCIEVNNKNSFYFNLESLSKVIESNKFLREKAAFEIESIIESQNNYEKWFLKQKTIKNKLELVDSVEKLVKNDLDLPEKKVRNILSKFKHMIYSE